MYIGLIFVLYRDRLYCTKQQCIRVSLSLLTVTEGGHFILFLSHLGAAAAFITVVYHSFKEGIMKFRFAPEMPL